MTQLSVNLNKIALIRNSRKTSQPNVVEAAATCIAAGAEGITVHPRPDMRHIRPSDVYDLAELLGKPEYSKPAKTTELLFNTRLLAALVRLL